MTPVAGFLLHFMAASTISIGAAWLLTRLVRPLSIRDALWKAAVLLAVLIPMPHAAATIARAQQGRQVVLRVRDRAIITELGAEVASSGPLSTHEGAVATPHTLWLLRRTLAGGLLALGLLNLLRQSFAWRRDLRALGPRRPLVDEIPARFRLPCHARVRFTSAPGLAVPAVVGAHEICLPAHYAQRFSTAELQAVLAHELAHVQHRDLDWARLTGAAAAFFFFQPLLRVARREIATIAEFRADQLAVQQTGDRQALVRALIRCAALTSAAMPLGVLTLRGESRFVHRVRRILDTAAPHSIIRRHGPWLLAGLLLVGSLPSFMLLRRAPRYEAEIVTRHGPAAPGPLVELREMTPGLRRDAEVTRAPDGSLHTVYRENGRVVEPTPARAAWLRSRLQGR